jgi:hypothetical protein
VPSKRFWSPGSTLLVEVDTSNPLAYGMPAWAIALFLDGNQAYEVIPSDRNHRVEGVVTFARSTGCRPTVRSSWCSMPW